MSIKRILKEQSNKKIFRVEGNFSCDNNNIIESLEGCPDYVGGDFDCQFSNLMSLEGSPKRVEGEFICYYNDLETLEGAPEYIGGEFLCDYNHLKSLDSFPEHVGGNFFCTKNPDLPKEEIIKLKESGKVKGRIYSDYGEF